MSRFATASVIALAAFGFSATTVKAADLDFEEPVIEHKPKVSVGGGFYLRGDIGYTIWTDPELDDDIGAPTSPYENEDLESTLFAGVGIGYDFGKYFRTDLTFDIRRDADLKADAPCGICAPIDPFTPVHSSLSAFTVLANGYLDAGDFHGFRPYIGAGVGGAYVDFGDTIVTGNPPPQAPIDAFPGESGFRFAWALMAGTSYAINKNLDLDLGYRYLNIADGEVANVISKGDPTQRDLGDITYEDLSAHEFRLGFRYTFGKKHKHHQPAFDPVFK